MLTRKQKLYAEARERGVGIKPAAIEAGCPEKTAAQAGSRLEKHKAVIEYRARLVAAKSAPAVHTADPLTSDAKEFLESAVRNPLLEFEQRMEAAKALLPYQHKKIGETGKKEQQREKAAELVEAGRFGGRPHLKAVK